MIYVIYTVPMGNLLIHRKMYALTTPLGNKLVYRSINAFHSSAFTVTCTRQKNTA